MSEVLFCDCGRRYSDKDLDLSGYVKLDVNELGYRPTVNYLKAIHQELDEARSRVAWLEGIDVEALRALDRIRDVMSEYLSDECVPMSELLAALDGEGEADVR